MARFRSMKRLSLAATLALVAACGRSANFLPPEDVAAPLFEVEYENYAWSPTWTGFYVDGEGNVYAWDRHGIQDATLSANELTPTQLAQKYAGRSIRKALSKDEVLQRYQQAAQAAQTGLTAPRGACADAGVTRFSAWVLDSGDGKYHRVLLHQRGDEAITRHSDANRAVWKWLDAATLGNTGDPICDPYAG